MGMDVYGKAPISKTGEYFRNNAWHWRPLAFYACELAPKITSACRHWQSNDGDGLDTAGAIALADRLQAEIDSGRCAIYAANYMARLDGTPDEDCPHCRGTGQRTEKLINGLVGGPWNSGEPWSCNACDGKGHRRPYSTYYPFSVENVQAFVNFLRDCGGFEIN